MLIVWIQSHRFLLGLGRRAISTVGSNNGNGCWPHSFMHKVAKGLICDCQLRWRLFWIRDDSFAISDRLRDQSAVIVAVDRQFELFASRGRKHIEALHDAKCLLLSI